MKQVKKKWTPKITNLRKINVGGEEMWVEFEIDGYIIPAGHAYYDIIRGINSQDTRKGA